MIGETEILGQAKKLMPQRGIGCRPGPISIGSFSARFVWPSKCERGLGSLAARFPSVQWRLIWRLKIFGHFESRKVLLLGAGEACERHGAGAGQAWGARHSGD